MEKPYSAACERNREPILEIMKDVITRDEKRLLEIGSGTGQHAVYFAPQFPWLEWYPTDVAENLKGMKLWFDEFKIPNIKAPVRLDVSKDDFPKLKFDVVFTANTFHIMHWKECKSLMKLLGHRLRENSKVMIYGPFKYGGAFTSPSNEEFDQQLKTRDPSSGIRSFEDVNNGMIKNGFELVFDYDMPANNRLLVYKRLKFSK
ncbi:MAG: class I SAM-dependent methyltransferase [Bacteriovoracaceae bacterium]|nr:class I SAM-dependent methyltransferase [Bacteriovoracaceae bacterium]